MRALPLILSTAAALVLARPILAFLQENGHLRENYRGARIPCPLGLLIPAAALVALIPLALLNGLLDTRDARDRGACTSCCRSRRSGSPTTRYAGPSRGWRGHGAAALKGSFSTGGAEGRRHARPRARLERADPGRRGDVPARRRACSSWRRTSSTCSTCGRAARSRRSCCSARR